MRLIDADVLVELFSERGHEYRKEYSYSKAREADAAQCIVRQAPTIEAEPVKHGRWVKRGNKWQCTHCKILMSIDGTPEENLLNYCPNCGSKNDGKEE